MGKESAFQSKLRSEILERYPGSIVTKFDSANIQGIPDLGILFPNGRWAALECKKSCNEKHQPNQDYYVERMNRMSFSAFIFPENKEEVLNAMETALEIKRTTRDS